MDVRSTEDVMVKAITNSKKVTIPNNNAVFQILWIFSLFGGATTIGLGSSEVIC
jgi:hypothetical protein